jgi:hypothetical protein
VLMLLAGGVPTLYCDKTPLLVGSVYACRTPYHSVLFVVSARLGVYVCYSSVLLLIRYIRSYCMVLVVCSACHQLQTASKAKHNSMMQAHIKYRRKSVNSPLNRSTTNWTNITVPTPKPKPINNGNYLQIKKAPELFGCFNSFYLSGESVSTTSIPLAVM